MTLPPYFLSDNSLMHTYSLVFGGNGSIRYSFHLAKVACESGNLWGVAKLLLTFSCTMQPLVQKVNRNGKQNS